MGIRESSDDPPPLWFTDKVFSLPDICPNLGAITGFRDVSVRRLRGEVNPSFHYCVSRENFGQVNRCTGLRGIRFTTAPFPPSFLRVGLFLRCGLRHWKAPHLLESETAEQYPTKTTCPFLWQITRVHTSKVIEQSPRYQEQCRTISLTRKPPPTARHQPYGGLDPLQRQGHANASSVDDGRGPKACSVPA